MCLWSTSNRNTLSLEKAIFELKLPKLFKILMDNCWTCFGRWIKVASDYEMSGTENLMIICFLSELDKERKKSEFLFGGSRINSKTKFAIIANLKDA